MECPLCFSERNELLGNLGPRAWWRCKACGWTHNTIGNEGFEVMDSDGFMEHRAAQRKERAAWRKGKR